MKTFLITIFILIQTISISAQSSISFRIGPNFSNLYAYSLNSMFMTSSDAKIVKSYSLVYINKINKKWNFGASLDMQPKKCWFNLSYGGQGVGKSYDIEAKLKYLYLSVFPEIRFENHKTFRLSFGPQLGYLVSSEGDSYILDWKYNYVYYEVTKLTSQKLDHYFSQYDLRLFLNLGFDYPLNEYLIVTFDTKISHGLINIEKFNNGFVERINTRDIGFLFGFKGKI